MNTEQIREIRTRRQHIEAEAALEQELLEKEQAIEKQAKAKAAKKAKSKKSAELKKESAQTSGDDNNDSGGSKDE